MPGFRYKPSSSNYEEIEALRDMLVDKLKEKK
jgi:hypothetical protein